MISCPSDEVLEAYAEGTVADEARGGVQAHVDGCTSCQSLLREMALVDPRATPLPPPSLMPTPDLIKRRSGSSGYRPGAMVGERYRLEKLLGSGGMGTVWAALHVGTNREVALKILRADHRATPAARLRFLREARILGRIDHPNLVPVRDVFEDREAPVLAMDLLRGESLADRLGRRGKLTAAELGRLLPGALSAIQVAHEAGVVHRDLKPDNLYIVPPREPGGEETLRVLDFGIAKLIDDEDPAAINITAKGEVLGTPPYMAPEQLRGELEIDQRADIWALGVILYECLSGRRPFTGDKFVQFHQRVTSGEREPLSVAAPQVPRDVVALVEKMLVVDREQRLPDLHEAIAVLRHKGEPKRAEPPADLRPGWRRTALLAALAGLLLLGAVGVSTWLDARREQARAGAAGTSATRGQ